MDHWFEIAIVSTVFAIGNILFGRFEEGTPRWRRLLKLVVLLTVAVAVSHYFGQAWFWVLLGLMLLPGIYIHAWWLPSKGVNGWTGEPRARYYELRGWKLDAKD